MLNQLLHACHKSANDAIKHTTYLVVDSSLSSYDGDMFRMIMAEMSGVKKEFLLGKTCSLLKLIFPVQFDYIKNEINIKYIPVHDLRVLLMNTKVFWDVMPC